MAFMRIYAIGGERTSREVVVCGSVFREGHSTEQGISQNTKIQHTGREMKWYRDRDRQS